MRTWKKKKKTAPKHQFVFFRFRHSYTNGTQHRIHQVRNLSFQNLFFPAFTKGKEKKNDEMDAKFVRKKKKKPMKNIIRKTKKKRKRIF